MSKCPVKASRVFMQLEVDESDFKLNDNVTIYIK